MSILMPYSPLDALIGALPEVRKAGRVRKDDTVLSVQMRIAEVFQPIVKRIEEEAVKRYQLQLIDARRTRPTGIQGS